MRKKSKYKPRQIIPDTMTWVRAGLKKVDEISAGTHIRIRNHDAMVMLRKGEATRQDMDVLIHAMNTAEGMTRVGLGADWQPEIRAAQDALFELARRGVANGMRFIVRGPELTALNLAMEVHDAQLDVATVVQMEKALAIVLEDVRLKKARRIIGSSYNKNSEPEGSGIQPTTSLGEAT